jgi:hypothetical protein
MALLWA